MKSLPRDGHEMGVALFHLVDSLYGEMLEENQELVAAVEENEINRNPSNWRYTKIWVKSQDETEDPSHYVVVSEDQSRKKLHLGCWGVDPTDTAFSKFQEFDFFDYSEAVKVAAKFLTRSNRQKEVHLPINLHTAMCVGAMH
jgi:hypothetical protein